MTMPMTVTQLRGLLQEIEADGHGSAAVVTEGGEDFEAPEYCDQQDCVWLAAP